MIICNYFYLKCVIERRSRISKCTYAHPQGEQWPGKSCRIIFQPVNPEPSGWTESRGWSDEFFLFSELKLTFHFRIFQKARLARIRIAKASSGAAFVLKKKAAEARLAAQESGVELDDAGRDEDIFELQHHHLLRCLERTTVRDVGYCLITAVLS